MIAPLLLLALQTPRPPPSSPPAGALEIALAAVERAKADGHGTKPILTLIDYSLPSTARRLWVIDLRTKAVLFHELVAHGKGSGDNYALRFSNVPQTRASSLGLFQTLDTYRGKHGYSLKLRGLERGVNDRAEARAIVIHGASYVSDAFAKEHGRLGRSWGCPALDQSVATQVIDAIKRKTYVYAYYEPRL